MSVSRIFPYLVALEVWMQSEVFLRLYARYPDSIAKLTPPNCRFPGYESVIREVGERSKGS
jgi:hypothetical protein